MVRRLLDHPNVHLALGTSFDEGMASFDRLIYTGPIDQYFDHLHGPLPYRSLRFEYEHHAAPFVQEAMQINFPNGPGDGPAFTRVTEFKHATGQVTPGSTLAWEYPQPHRPGENEPYYPIPSPETRARHRRYAAEAARLDHVVFAGRLGTYRYLNMDQAVGHALSVFEKQIARRP